MLLEIGFWTPLSFFTEKQHTLNTFCDYLIRLTRVELPRLVGTIYADAVRACLKVDQSTSDAAAQEILCWKVSAALDRCIA